MRLDGEWLQCDDGDVRPIIRGELCGADGVWRPLEFLVDTGADRTVLSASALEESHLPSMPPDIPVGGFGGITQTVLVDARFRLFRDDGTPAIFNGRFAPCTEIDALELSVLGRDVLNMFSLIVDRSANVVAVIGQDHTYTIHRRR
jgi:hypothetical protein